MNAQILPPQGTKRRAHDYIGWALIGAAVFMFVTGLTQIRWREPYQALVVIPVAALLFGVVAMPGVLVLKRRWGDLARLGSGVVCLTLFFFATNWTNEFLRGIDSSMIGDSTWAVIGPVLALGPALLAWWLKGSFNN